MSNVENLKYSFNEDIIFRVTDEVVLAYNEDKGEFYEFNDIGGEIFLFFKDHNSLSNLFEHLCNNYDVTESDIFEDVMEIVNRMNNLSIITQI